MNEHLVKACIKRRSAVLRGHAATIGMSLAADLAAFKGVYSPRRQFTGKATKDVCGRWARSVKTIGLASV